MNYPLLVHKFLERTAIFYPDKEIITREEGSNHRYTYDELMNRSTRLSNALTELGVRQGDRVGTFAWNQYRHLEVYFAAPAMGGVLHLSLIHI